MFVDIRRCRNTTRAYLLNFLDFYFLNQEYTLAHGKTVDSVYIYEVELANLINPNNSYNTYERT